VLGAFVDDHAESPLAGLSRQLKPGEVVELGLESRDIEAEIDVGRFVLRALKAVEAKEAKARNLKEAGVCLRVAAAKLNRKAGKHPFKYAKAKQALADALNALDEKTKELASMYELCGVDDAEALAAEADLSEAAASAQAQEAAVRVQLKERLDAIVEGLKGRWGTESAHAGLRSFLIEGTKSKIATLAEEAEIMPLGTVRLYGETTMTLGGSFVAPTGFAFNKSVGANLFLFEKVDGRWVALTGSAVSKNEFKTIMWYRLVKKAVKERADIKESIRALLLKALEESGASGASGPASPWHAVLSNGDFDLDVFIHARKFSATGLVMYQLPLVVARESMTPELAETMATVKTSMTAGSKPGEGPRYFTMRERGSIGCISLAVAGGPAVLPAAADEAVESGAERQGDDEMGVERQGDDEMGVERQGDDEMGVERQGDEQEESEAVGRMASVSASGSRKRKSCESVESLGKRQQRCKPTDEAVEAVEAERSEEGEAAEAVAKAVEEAMESGTFGLGEDADDDTRAAFFLKGNEKIKGRGGLKEQIGVIQIKVKGLEALSAGWKSPVSGTGEELVAAMIREMQDLEGQRARLWEAMQEAVFCFDELKYVTLCGAQVP
jgi:hypothetical protein